jgi:cytochrome c-type biogenesis protein CcmH/NrfF
MSHPHLTLAAHLLLWVYPLVLVVLTIADLIRDTVVARDRA